jgi:hypothetical protein
MNNEPSYFSFPVQFRLVWKKFLGKSTKTSASLKPNSLPGPGPGNP